MNERISWITPEYFIDVDLPIINKLSMRYRIRWIIIISNNAQIDYERFIADGISSKNKIEIIVKKQLYRSRSIKNLSFYYQLISIAKSFEPAIYYISYSAMPYGILLYRMFLPLKKCVVACHNVTTPKGAHSEKMAALYTHWWLSAFRNIQVFSEGQHNKLKEKYINKNILNAPLAIKDYGEASSLVKKEKLPFIRFLFFGNVVEYKRLDILLKATNKLVERGEDKFRVRVAGSCNEWDKYKQLIKYPEYVELQIKRIPNEHVADLFAESHYFVLPYQDIAQSGAITVAFRYNLPTIVSDIEQFSEFVTDGETGIMFESGNADDLADKMQYVIDKHTQIYPQLCNNQKEFVRKNLSLDSIVDKYIKYFDCLLCKNPS